MIIYLADRNLNILAVASSQLPEGLRLINDSKTEEIENGTKTFSCKIIYDEYSRSDVESAVSPGYYILKHTDDEDEFYSIIDAEYDLSDQYVSVYGEDAGLDLLNTQVGAYAASAAKSLAWYVSYFCGNNGWVIKDDESTSTLKLSWDGESTLTERLLSIATNFGCELSYSFDIERLKINQKNLNFYKTRGNGQAVVQTRLGREIADINIIKSAQNHATAFAVTGGTPKNSSTPINLKGYSWSRVINGDTYSVDTTTGQVRNIDAMSRWSGVLDTDGLIIKQYSYDTTDKATLASHAAAELSKVCDLEVNYAVSFVELNAKIGDRINVIDDAGELYLDSRILSLTTSECNGTVDAVLGDHIIKTAGVSDRLLALAEQAQKEAVNASEIYISSSNGIQFKNAIIDTTFTATVRYGEKVITNQTELEDTYGIGARIVWENSNTLLGVGFSLAFISSNNSETIIARIEA